MEDLFISPISKGSSSPFLLRETVLPFLQTATNQGDSPSHLNMNNVPLYHEQ